MHFETFPRHHERIDRSKKTGENWGDVAIRFVIDATRYILSKTEILEFRGFIRLETANVIIGHDTSPSSDALFTPFCAHRLVWRYVKTILENQAAISMNVILVKLPLFVLFLAMSGCSTVQSGTGGNWIGYSESGLASFYADKHQNKKTASGEPYKHTLKTAAHKRLPFGSNVKVTNINNGKSVVVKVNDRGPFVKGRIIDLSKSAFSGIGNPSSGLINVKIEVIR